MSSKMSRNKKKKLKLKAKKAAEIRKIQMQQLAEVEMKEQTTAGSSCPRSALECDEEEEEKEVQCSQRNGSHVCTANKEHLGPSPLSLFSRIVLKLDFILKVRRCHRKCLEIRKRN